jgi:hypothetical protein
MRVGMKVYTFDIDLETADISNIERQMDRTGFQTPELHGGLEDLEYDRDIPNNFGKEE